MDLDQLIEGAEVRVLRIQPGDTLVLRYPGLLSDREFQEISERVAAPFKRRYPDVEIVIVERGADFTVVRKDEN